MGAYEHYLSHFGIKGQKWGKRRYQNEDGTYTDEGKARRSNQNTSKQWKPKEASSLSDDELNRRNARLLKEQQYKRMTDSGLKAGLKRETKDILKKVFIATAVSVATIVVRKKYQQWADKGETWLEKAKAKRLLNKKIKSKVKVSAWVS